MAYTNKPKALLTAVQALLHGEFGAAVPVFFGTPDSERAAHWFEVRLLRSENVGDAAFFVSRRYVLSVAYLMRATPAPGHKALGERYEVAARMEGLLDRNQVNDGEWIDGRVGDIDYQHSPEGREDDNLTGVLMEWAVTVSETIS